MKQAMADIKLAVAIRKLAESINMQGATTSLGFTCPECGEQLSIHIGGMQGDHFEHLPSGKQCPLRDKSTKPR